jgi:hypothetical protein
MSNHAGAAEASGTQEPRLTLVPARCAVGISASGAGFRVVHTMSGKELGSVARAIDSGWCFVSPCACYIGEMWDGTSESGYPTADAAATALSAHVLDHKLSAIRDRLALAAGGEVA